MPFVNTLPYISNPIEEFKDYRFVNWESGIYPTFKAGTKREEIQFFVNLITSRGLRKILDLGVRGGMELAAIAKSLGMSHYPTDSMEANEIDGTFIDFARKHFKSERLAIPVHQTNWLDLPRAVPPYTHNFDFAFLTGNSLTYIGGGTREYTKRAQQSVVSKFADIIEKGGYLFIDTRNYDYIHSLINLSREEISQRFTFNYSIYYHGFQEKIVVFPAYISDTVVVLHYYDKEQKLWSKLDLYPIYQADMLDILSKDFDVEKIFYDFKKGSQEKSLFVQYLAKRR